MDAHFFYKEINRIKSKYLEKYRFNAVSNKLIENTFIISKKMNYNESLNESSPIIQLINNYNLSNLEIGLISFNEEIVNYQNTLIFGMLESVDPLIITNEGEIEVRDRFNFKSQYKCANNELNFLKALLICADFLLECGCVDDLWENQNEIKKTVQLATHIAGGVQYINFYKLILGDFE